MSVPEKDLTSYDSFISPRELWARLEAAGIATPEKRIPFQRYTNLLAIYNGLVHDIKARGANINKGTDKEKANPSLVKMLDIQKELRQYEELFGISFTTGIPIEEEEKEPSFEELLSWLRPKQAAFVQEYIVSLNATQAAKKAGYSAKTAKSVGQENLTKPDIQKAIQAALRDRSERTQVDADYVIKNLTEIVERSMQRAPVYDMRGRQVRDENGNNLWRFDARGANKALELLGKHLGMFVDKKEISGPDGKSLMPPNISVVFTETEDNKDVGGNS